MSFYFIASVAFICRQKKIRNRKEKRIYRVNVL